MTAACNPALNWREVSPPGGLKALFPCRPSREVRTLDLAGARTEMTMLACQADGAMYALASADVKDPDRVARALQALRDAAQRNLGAREQGSRAAAVRGMTPNPAAAQARLEGRHPEGHALREELLVFSKGTWVFQATRVAPTWNDEAADTFFTGVRWP